MQLITLYPVLVYRADQDWLLKLRPVPLVDGANYSNMYANDKVKQAKFKFSPATTENKEKWCLQLKFNDLIAAIWFTEETEFSLENVPEFPTLPANISTRDPDFIHKLEVECLQTFSRFCQLMDTLAKDTTSANAKKTLEAALASLSSTFTAQGDAAPQKEDDTEVQDLTEKKTSTQGREATGQRARSLMLPNTQVT